MHNFYEIKACCVHCKHVSVELGVETLWVPCFLCNHSSVSSATKQIRLVVPNGKCDNFEESEK